MRLREAIKKRLSFPEKPEWIEILDFKNKEGLSKFKINTSEAGCFTKCLLSSENVLQQASQWKAILDKQNKKAFPKIRVRPKKLKVSAADSLMNKRN